MIRSAMMLLVSAVLFAGCTGGNKDLVIAEKNLRVAANASSAGGMGGVSVPTSSWIYWVEGTIKNVGTDEVKNVQVSFVLTDGGEKITLTGDVASIPPGGQAPFRTDQHVTARTLRFTDAEPEIMVK